jgi:hypothetical protein
MRGIRRSDAAGGGGVFLTKCQPRLEVIVLQFLGDFSGIDSGESLNSLFDAVLQREVIGNRDLVLLTTPGGS